MPQLISEELNTEFSNLVGKLFALNRLCDRGVSVLSVVFAMNKSSEIIHKKICHLAPAIADLISEFQDGRGCLTIYPATPIGNSLYQTPKDFFQELFDFMVLFEGDVESVKGLAQENGDYASMVFLDSFMLKILPLTRQCLLLLDKINAYDDIMLFDHNIEDFIIL